jgi:type VI protein secretion system component Hcp
MDGEAQDSKHKKEIDVLSWSWGMSNAGSAHAGGEDRLTENITLNFSKVSLDYVPQDDKGAPRTAIPMAWDIGSNSNN